MWEDAYGYNTRGERPELNVKELVNGMDWVDFKNGLEGEPLWYQESWALWGINGEAMAKDYRDDGLLREAEIAENYCGTAFCFAGYTAREHAVDGVLPRRIDIDGVSTPIAYPESAHGEWSLAGREILGLSHYEASKLFEATNSKEDIRRIINEILAHRGESITV